MVEHRRNLRIQGHRYAMPSKITFGASVVASAATAFGMGALAFNSPFAPPVSLPPQSAPDVEPEGHAVPTGTAKPEAVPTFIVLPTPQARAYAPQTEPTTGRHAKPRTAPETDAGRATLPRHAKPTPRPTTTPSEEPTAGDAGPLNDAQDDGKVLDDLGNALFPNTPGLPDVLLPFPGHGEGLADYDGPNPEDVPYADPGVVCDPELAANLGVPLGDCAAEPNLADTWHPVEVEPDNTVAVARF